VYFCCLWAYGMFFSRSSTSYILTQVAALSSELYRLKEGHLLFYCFNREKREGDEGKGKRGERWRQEINYYSLNSTRFLINLLFNILWFCLQFYMDVKLGLSHYRMNIDWGCLRAGCWGEYLGRRDMKWHQVGENCIMRSFLTCTL
jgi:hypothetical protein